MADDVVTMDKIVALCKRRGLIFPASEIYGGIANTYDYGHYGVLLKRNVVDAWWRAMVFERDDIVALDSAIIQHPRTWEASGHLAGFTDPLVDCRTCKLRFRADHLEEARAGAPGREELRCGRAPSKLPGEHPACHPRPGVARGERERPGLAERHRARTRRAGAPAFRRPADAPDDRPSEWLRRFRVARFDPAAGGGRDRRAASARGPVLLAPLVFLHRRGDFRAGPEA